jgi:hypothetical protein
MTSHDRGIAASSGARGCGGDETDIGPGYDLERVWV